MPYSSNLSDAEWAVLEPHLRDILTQLFHALCSYQRNELDVAEFWNTVFNTNGVCPLPEV